VVTSGYINHVQVLLVVLSGLALFNFRAELCSLSTCLMTLKGQNSILLALDNISFYMLFPNEFILLKHSNMSLFGHIFLLHWYLLV